MNNDIIESMRWYIRYRYLSEQMKLHLKLCKHWKVSEWEHSVVPGMLIRICEFCGKSVEVREE